MLVGSKPPVIAYSTGHIHSETICRAFAEGSGGIVRAPGQLIRSCPLFVFGLKRGGKGLIDNARAVGQPWFYGDNGYFCRGYYDGFFKITRGHMQVAGDEAGDLDRWRRHGLEIQPWRRAGREILICPPIPEYCRLFKFNGAAWLETTKARIRSATDRPIRVRYKPGDPRFGRKSRPLDADLAGAWALVTHDSNVVVEALLAGVPVFVSEKAAQLSPARCMGRTDLGLIESPLYPDDRERWFSTLAANQWTLDEIRRGLCRETLCL